MKKLIFSIFIVLVILYSYSNQAFINVTSNYLNIQFFSNEKLNLNNCFVIFVKSKQKFLISCKVKLEKEEHFLFTLNKFSFPIISNLNLNFKKEASCLFAEGNCFSKYYFITYKSERFFFLILILIMFSIIFYFLNLDIISILLNLFILFLITSFWLGFIPNWLVNFFIFIEKYFDLIIEFILSVVLLSIWTYTNLIVPIFSLALFISIPKTIAIFTLIISILYLFSNLETIKIINKFHSFLPWKIRFDITKQIKLFKNIHIGLFLLTLSIKQFISFNYFLFAFIWLIFFLKKNKKSVSS